MIPELHGILDSLASLLREETALLVQAADAGQLGAIAAAKIRVTAALEAQLAMQTRVRPDWQNDMTDEERGALSQTFAELQSAAAENASMLARHIELSRDLLGAIAAEAKRLSGTRTETYRATGGLHQADLPSPISVNARL